MSAQWKGKTRGGKAGNFAFIFLLKHLGINAAYTLLIFVSAYFVVFVRSARNPMYYFYRKVLHFSLFKSIRYLFLNSYRFGQVLIDKVAIMSGMESHYTFNFEGEQHLHQMAVSTGGFIIGAHIGNWEIAGHLLKRIPTRVHIVMLEAEHEKIKNMLNQVMTEKSMSIIPIKQDLSHLFAIQEAMARNELIAIHGDRFLEGSKPVSMPFFGLEADFPTGPFSMAIRFGKPMTFVSAMRMKGKHYHFFATPPTTYPSERKTLNTSLKIAMSAYIREMERVLKKFPEQWFNYYYFWKQNPTS